MASYNRITLPPTDGSRCHDHRWLGVFDVLKAFTVGQDETRDATDAVFAALKAARRRSANA